ncbi:MAG TPA: hypothetical protein VIY86_09985 [Pirellulaceae bacterium]
MSEPFKARNFLVVMAVVLTGCLLHGVSWCQYYGTPPAGYRPPYGPTPYQPYSSYYQQQWQTYHRPSSSPQNYTIDRYFYHRPTISPYLNLARRSGPYVNNYYAYVKPEVERRNQTMRPPSLPGVPGTLKPSEPSPYYGHWYQPR